MAARLASPSRELLCDLKATLCANGGGGRVESKASDVIVFDCYMPHGAPANASSGSRCNVFVTFNRVSAGELRAHYHADSWASSSPNKTEEARRRAVGEAGGCPRNAGGQPLRAR